MDKLQIEELLLDGVKESVIRNTFRLNKFNEAIEKAEEDLRLEYERLYPTYDENGNEIEYLEYVDIVEKTIETFDENGDLNVSTVEEYIYKDEFYRIVHNDNMDEPTNEVTKILTDRANELLALNKVRPTLDYYISINNIEIDEIDITEEYIELIQPALKKLLAKLQEVKFTNAEKYVSENLELSDAMLRSYTLKKEIAKEAIETKDYSLFTVEAASRGMTPEELTNEILRVNKKWTGELGKLNDMIEGFRAGANKVIDRINSLEMLNDVMNAFDIAFKLDASAKPEDIIALYEPFKEDK